MVGPGPAVVAASVLVPVPVTLVPASPHPVSSAGKAAASMRATGRESAVRAVGVMATTVPRVASMRDRWMSP